MGYRLKRTYSWNRRMAYIVGLITTDGCLLNDKRHIDFTSKDLQLVELYRDMLRPTAKIGIKLSGSGKSYYRVQLGDVSLYNFLENLGLTPRKSLTLNQLAVPSTYFADFLRGCFDGDGSVYGVVDKRWPNSYMFYTCFASASLPFLEWLKTELAAQLPDIGGHIRRSATNLYQLSYGKADTRQIFRFMYYDPSVSCLHRKHQRYLEIFKLDPYAK